MRAVCSAPAVAACLLCLTLSECSKEPATGAAPASSTSTLAAAAAPRPSALPSAKPAPTSIAWSGTYESAPGSLYVYDGGEWKGVHFRGDDASIGLGEGPLSFSVDAKTSLVRGTASGPLGDVVIAGAVTNEEVTFTVVRKDPTDRGFTGTGEGKVTGDSLTGTIRLSRGDAHVIREAKFTLTRPAT